MKMGDIVLNQHAGEKNPHRISVFIGYSNGLKKCLCLDGHIATYARCTKLDVVGHIPIKEQIELHDVLTKQTRSE